MKTRRLNMLYWSVMIDKLADLQEKITISFVVACCHGCFSFHIYNSLINIRSYRTILSWLQKVRNIISSFTTSSTKERKSSSLYIFRIQIANRTADVTRACASIHAPRRRAYSQQPLFRILQLYVLPPPLNPLTRLLISFEYYYHIKVEITVGQVNRTSIYNSFRLKGTVRR